jgi:hypothetical protein
MPWNRKLYPKNWEDISLQIKTAANWQCQDCGRVCRRPGEKKHDFEERLMELDPLPSDLYEYVADEESGEWGYVPKFGRFTLTVAHLNHEPSDCSPENLRALCAPCHCRMDLAAIPQKQRMKAERLGQLTLIPTPAGHGKDPSREQPPLPFPKPYELTRTTATRLQVNSHG